jgi:[acyl-carrier-protein] S-malonyltransferase
MKVVLLFAGQGAQKVGMGKDLAESSPAVKALFDQADSSIGFPLSQVMFEGPAEELTRTSRCQPALYVHGLAAWTALKERVPNLEVVATAGLSLGEFTAHQAADTYDFATGLKLLFHRGTYMEEACEQTKGAMVALIGGSEELARQLAKDCDVDVANLNAPGQIVLSGKAEGIASAVAQAKERGFKMVVPLPVAGAYHSRLMKTAQDKLATVLAATEFATPSVPVICNYEARAVSGADDIRSMLAHQVTGSVRWAESMQSLIAQGHTLFIEFSPDGALAGMMKRTDKSAKVIVVSDAASLEAAVTQWTA